VKGGVGDGCGGGGWRWGGHCERMGVVGVGIVVWEEDVSLLYGRREI